MEKKNDFKFCNIEGAIVIWKPIKAKIIKILSKTSSKGEPYLRVTLGQGVSKAEALAFGEQKILAVERLLQEGETRQFNPGTFRSQKRDMKYKHTSDSTIKYDLIFRELIADDQQPSHASPQPSTSASVKNVPQPDADSLLHDVIKKIPKVGKFMQRVANVRLSGGYVYRYVGCNRCSSSKIAFRKDGVFCRGKTCKKGGRSAVKTTEMHYMIIKDITIQCATNPTDKLAGLVVFNNEAKALLGRPASGFIIDQEVTAALKKVWENVYNLDLKRHNKNGKSTYSPSIFISAATLCDGYNPPSCSLLAPMSDIEAFSFDVGTDIDGEFRGKKKKVKRQLPKLLPLTVKIEHCDPQALEGVRKVLAEAYHLRSKPPGLVLLINNYKFATMRDRIGSEIDVQNLMELFLLCGYELFQKKCFKNVKDRKEFECIVEGYKKELEERNLDSSIVIVMSHGTDSQLSMCGEKKQNRDVNIVNDLFLPFSKINFKCFAEKPKIFIIQGCRVFENSDYTENLNFIRHGLYNAYFCLSTFAGFNSMRSEKDKEGSPFIYFMVKNIMKYATSLEFDQIIQLVKREMEAIVTENEAYEVPPPVFFSTTFRKFYFPNILEDIMDLGSDTEDMDN